MVATYSFNSIIRAFLGIATYFVDIIIKYHLIYSYDHITYFMDKRKAVSGLHKLRGWI